MPNDNIENLSRRDFLAMSSMAAASLAAGGISSSARAQDQEPQERPKEFVNPSSKKLELLFLGTGAANWPSTYPADIKNLPRGEVRGMSSMLVNGQILIDCGPTVLEAMKCYGVSPAGVTDILLTHTHPDHLHDASVLAIANARDSALGPLRFWAHPEALKLVPESDRIEKKPVEIGKSFNVHELGLTGLEANHQVGGSKEQCLIYLIEGATRSALYATDGSWLLTSTWNHLRKKQLDAIIWDATVGEGKGDSRIFSHNDLTMIRHMNQSLANENILKPDAKILLTHIARGLHPPHGELETKVLPEGLIPAYDGMIITLN